MEQGIRDLYKSGRYAEYLAAMSKFHHYSFGNALRILLQCPAATHVEIGQVPGTAKGYTSFRENRIVVKSHMSEVQTVKTLVHEIAHAKLHTPEEAERVAYVVCQHFGIDTSDYSFGYVAGWSRGKELAELKASLDVIHSTAREIIDAISPPPPRREGTAAAGKIQETKGSKSMSDYEERRQARIDRYREKAEQARAESASLFQQSTDMASAIPLGQPIHGPADRRYRERVEKKMVQSFAASDKADYYERRAQAAEENTAIPDTELRQELKSSGFRWARSEETWRRQLTDNAIYAAGRIKAIRPSDGNDPVKIQPKRKPKQR